MPAYRCSDCAVDWPVQVKYRKCPGCGTPTSNMNTSAMTIKDAERKAAHLRFERFYRVWDEERQRRGEPSPEVIGAEEAREQVRREREQFDRELARLERGEV